jgi:hypothetical protein
MDAFINFMDAFAPKVGMFIGGCAIAVFVVGLVARMVFKDARKDDKKAPLPTTPPRPETSDEPGVTAA